MFTRRIIRDFILFIIITRVYCYYYNKFITIFLFKTIISNIIEETLSLSIRRAFIIIKSNNRLNDRLNVFKRFEDYRDVVDYILYEIVELKRRLNIFSIFKSHTHRRRYYY